MGSLSPKRVGPKRAIADKCRSCIHDPAAPGTWRQQVQLCSCYGCPLWEHRPKSYGAVPQQILEAYNVSPNDLCLLKSVEKPQTTELTPRPRARAPRALDLLPGAVQTAMEKAHGDGAS